MIAMSTAGEAVDLATSTVVAEPDRIVATHLRELVTAARGKQRVEIEYVSASRHPGARSDHPARTARTRLASRVSAR